MARFFVSPHSISSDTAVLTGEQAAHAKVLRLSPGESVTLCDGQGTDYHCVVDIAAAKEITLHIKGCEPSRGEPQLHCSIYMGFPKADKLEHVIQKATELGAAEIVAFPCARSISKPDAKSLSKKLERWQKIAESAAEQSGRGRIPAVLALSSFEEAVSRAAKAQFSALFYENERTLSLRTALSLPCSSAALMTGPEGGLTEQEVAAAQKAGLRICSLGPRILRCETAPLCALSALLFAAGEMD